MILSYKILGAVSLTDFLKTVKKGAINIIIRDYSIEKKSQEKTKFFYHYLCGLESEDQMVKFQENVLKIEDIEDSLVSKIAEAKKEILEKAIEVAEKLIILNFEIALNGKRIGIRDIYDFKNKLKSKPDEMMAMFFTID